MKQYIYKLIAIAGTFDKLHKGHEFFISQAFRLGKKVIIGITSDSYVREKLKAQSSKLKANVNNYKREEEKVRNLGDLRHRRTRLGRLTSRMHSFQVERLVKRLGFKEREKELRNFLRQEGLLKRAEIVKIDDIYGPTVEKVNPPSPKATARRGEIEALVVTRETLAGARAVNRKRRSLGLSPLKIIKINLVVAQDKRRISSCRIRSGEIDRQGRVLSRIGKWGVPISEGLRGELKKPQGVLIKGDLVLHKKKVAFKLKKIVNTTQPVAISTVGDEATKLCNEIGIAMDLAIVDYKVRRVKVYKSLSDLGFLTTNSRFNLEKSVVTVRNPAGNITKSLVEAIKKAYLICHPERIPILHPFPFIIRVIGEEDLAGVPAILLAPLGSIVLYGQPAFAEASTSAEASVDKSAGKSADKPGEGIVVVEVTEEKKEEMRNLLKKYAV